MKFIHGYVRAAAAPGKLRHSSGTQFSANVAGFRASHARYYEQPPTLAGIVAAARKIKLAPDVRKGVVEVLREQNRAFGAGADTFGSLDRLASGAAAIVTGQQVGLFTGPAYSFYKAISAARIAEEVSRKGVEAVPIFWLATEDHDLAEINHVEWNTESGL